MFRLKHHKATVRSMANKLKVNRGTWARHSYPEKRTKIRKFGLRDGNASNFFKQHSSVAPDKKLVSKKTGEGAAFLQKSLKQLHNEYKEASGDSIPFSSLAKCRPKNVRLMSQAKLRQCLCEYCTNITLKLDTLKSFATRHRQYGCIINNERDAVRIITCDVIQRRNPAATTSVTSALWTTWTTTCFLCLPIKVIKSSGTAGKTACRK